jgi:hypothetical protein
MVTWQSVEAQLKRVGCNYVLWGSTEVHELANILMDSERIVQAVNGYYDGGFALLTVTNYRVIVVDKKPFLLTVEDLRYDMIAEVDYSARVFTSILHIITPLRSLDFTSWSTRRLRSSMNYIQQRVMELRNNEFLANQFAQQHQMSQGSGLQPDDGTGGQAPDLLQIREQQRRVPQMVPTLSTSDHPIAQFDGYKPKPLPGLQNPYTKVPLLARRRKYPSFY